MGYGLKTKDRCSTCVSLHNKIKALSGKRSKKKKLEEAQNANEEHEADYRWRRDRILELKLSADLSFMPKNPQQTREEQYRQAIAEAKVNDNTVEEDEEMKEEED